MKRAEMLYVAVFETCGHAELSIFAACKLAGRNAASYSFGACEEAEMQDFELGALQKASMLYLAMPAKRQKCFPLQSLEPADRQRCCNLEVQDGRLYLITP